MKTMTPAVVIGTHTMGLGVIRALGRMGVPIIAVYYNQSDMGYVSKYVQEAIHCPHPELNTDQFMETLFQIGSRYANSPLIPVSDESLKVVSRHKQPLAQCFKVACPEWEIVQQLIEKSRTYNLAISAGVPVPKTIIPSSADELTQFGQSLEFPCLIKPVESHLYFALFKRKLVQANNLDQVLSAYREAAQAGLKVMVQEFIPGEDDQGVNYNSYFWEGQALVEFTAQKIRGAPAVFGSPCVARSRAIPDVLEAGRAILRSMAFYGYSCTEFKRDARDGVYKLMEVNGRHNLSTLLAVRCGINFPWLHYLHLVEGLLPIQNEYQKNVYWIDTERDLAHLPKRFKNRKASLSGILRPYLGIHVQAVFDLRDLKPFLKRYLDFIKKTFRARHPVAGTPEDHS